MHVLHYFTKLVITLVLETQENPDQTSTNAHPAEETDMASPCLNLTGCGAGAIFAARW